MVQFQCVQQRKQVPPTLPVAPPNLTSLQLKRRHIVTAIIHSENSYVSTLQRLVNVRNKKYFLPLINNKRVNEYLFYFIYLSM